MRKFWVAFWAVFLLSFAVLGYTGVEIYQKAPPIPTQVNSTDGSVVIKAGDIEKGQNVWQAMGGMEVGSIWGHGSYVAPDWTADWLHREAVFILNEWSTQEFNSDYDKLDVENKAALQARLEKIIRTNTYDEVTGKIVIDPIRVEAFEENVKYYSNLFTNGHQLYAIPKNSVTDPERLRQMSSFFFWSSWAASTNRPDSDRSYTSNWPHEQLVGNRPTGDAVVWTGVSIIVLLAGISGMVWFFASRTEEHDHPVFPLTDPLLYGSPTPSQIATIKYFWIVAALIFVQISMGVITAHYGVEGTGFYGIPIDQYIPYSLTRTWHTQLGIFWIATAWLGAGLYIGPVISGFEPKNQKLGVNILFLALLIVVVGSFIGQWLSVMNMLPGDTWFYFGHQGYEYVDLGRVWQIALLIGLFLWLFLVARCVIPALKRGDDQKPILTLFLISTIAIASFYAAGLMWGKNTNLAIVEYWRWWVVHLWVEGFFEVFATVVIAFLFARMKLIKMATANKSVVFSSTIFLSGGIIGTLHHLYFSGTPTLILALGAVFSALEVVPLVLVGIEAWENIRLTKSTDWVEKYKWPIYFFVSVAFWNMLGAGIFGFMINPPIALYYMQGLNTTAVHGHTALFGVYGMLGIGLMLFCLRAMWPNKIWNEKPIKISFWSINIGLFLMVAISVLPVGLMQTWASVEHGYWYARSAEFMNTPTMQFFKWMRIPGDTIFAIGAFIMVGFIFWLGLKPPSEEVKVKIKQK